MNAIRGQWLGSFVGYALLLLLGFAVEAPAANPQNHLPNRITAETGSFKILFGGEEIGEEKFQIVRDGPHFRATAEVQLTQERNEEKITFSFTPLLTFTTLLEPISYEIIQEARGYQVKTRVDFKTEVAVATYESGREKELREIDLKKDAVVLDDNVFHHYIILVWRYDFTKAGIQEFSGFVPQQFLAGNITVADKGMDQVKLGDKTSPLRHLLVDTGEIQIGLWLNDRHELRKISVPKSNVEVFRN